MISPADDAPLLEAVVEDAGWRALAPDPEALAQRCHAAARARAPRLDGAVAVLFADDAALARLNAAFRGRQGPTNVLSFPAEAPAQPAPQTEKASNENARFESAGFQNTRFLGDIALARETCVREAARAGAPFADHAMHLIVHGLLHLIGYDHQTDSEADEMETLEIGILADLGVDDPYARASAEDAARPLTRPLKGGAG